MSTAMRFDSNFDKDVIFEKRIETGFKFAMINNDFNLCLTVKRLQKKEIYSKEIFIF